VRTGSQCSQKIHSCYSLHVHA